MQRRALILVTSAIPLIPRAAASQTPQVPITVRAEPAIDTLRSGGPLPLRITVSNGLREEIYFLAYTLTPNEWNGETANLTIFDVYRERDSSRVDVHRPDVRVPIVIAGKGRKVIPARGSLSWVVDMAKWHAEGGWQPGKYKMLVRVEAIHVDRFLMAWATSDTVRLEIK